jgi:hypothetical protein
LALQKRPASPKGVANAHRFAYKRRAQRSANNISSVFNIARLLLAVAHTASLIFPELTYNLGSTDRKWKYGKIKMKSK